MSPRGVILLCLSGWLASSIGCATAPGRVPARHGLSVRTSSTASLGMYPAPWGLPSRLVDTRTRRAVPLDVALRDLQQARVVYVGESHDNPHHHAVQAAMLLHLWAADRSLGLGLEMFQRPFQAPLAAYGRGELAEADFLAQTEYAERWGHDFALYRPLLELAVAHHVPLYALNAPRELTRKIARQGLDALTPEERAQVPELDRGSASHRSMVRAAFDEHGMPADRFEAFYTAQLVWDETMAQTVAEVLAGPEAPARMLVLAGLGHVRGGLGIPRRAAQRGAKPHVTIIPVMLGEDEPTLDQLLDDPEADYLWVMAAEEALLPPLGVELGT